MFWSFHGGMETHMEGTHRPCRMDAPLMAMKNAPLAEGILLLRIGCCRSAITICFCGSSFSRNVGLSTVSAAGIIRWTCQSGSFGPPLGAMQGDWDGCPYLCRPICA